MQKYHNLKSYGMFCYQTESFIYAPLDSFFLAALLCDRITVLLGICFM